jgi:YbbR domain-containing protein
MPLYFIFVRMNKKINIIIISLIFSVILWVSISLSSEYYASIKVNLKIIDLPYGYIVGTKLPGNIIIKLKGKGWKLTSESLGSEAEFIASAKYDSGKINLNLYNSLSENRWLANDIEVIKIDPDTISFKVEKIVSKKIKIIPTLNLNFKPGYGLAEPVYIYPDSMFVYGPWSIIKNLNFISTEYIAYDKIDSRIKENLTLNPISGISYGINSVALYLNVQKIVDMNFDDLPVKIYDIPNDRDIILLQNKVSIGVKGGIELLGKLTSDQFKVSLNYRNITMDTLGSVIPDIQMPPNLSLLYVKPERLHYIIKKY